MIPALALLLGVALASPQARVIVAPPARGDSASPKRLLLVTWDTTRADRLGAYGWKRARTPAFDALAASGVLYERASSAAPITLPAHTTLLTGVYPCAHGVRDNAIFEVTPSARLLSEALHDAGFRTGAFVGSFVLDPKFGLAQGFDVYDAPDPAQIGLGWNVIERPAVAVGDAALRFVDTLTSEQSFFLWVHCFDPHAPHQVPPGLVAPNQDDYDAEIALCDRELARLLARLRERHLDDGLLTVVTADHGESLGEHGELTHSNFLYDATMRVPLVIAPPPDGVAPGTRVRAPVSTADVAATLLERLGLGRALLPDAKTPLLPSHEAGGDERALYLETFAPFHAHRWHPLRAVIWKGFKYVEAPRPELYELAADPGETHDMLAAAGTATPTDAHRDLATRMAARLAALAAEHPGLGWQTAGALSSEDQERLHALGYAAAASGGDANEENDATLPDAKDRIADLGVLDEVEQLLHDASALLGFDDALRTGRRPLRTPEQQERGAALLEQARTKVTALAAADPRDPQLSELLATIALNRGDHAGAIAPLERALVATPRVVSIRYNLAVAYAQTGQEAWGQREMEKVVHVEPRSLAAHRWLAQFTVSQHDWPAAAFWLDELRQCPGQKPGDLDGVAAARRRVQQELDKTHGEPRPPAPVTDGDLVPEGVRARAPAKDSDAEKHE